MSARCRTPSRRGDRVGLILPSPGWAHCTSNITGTPSTTVGTAVTAGANNADGSSVALLTAVDHDVEYLVIQIAQFTLSGSLGKVLLDILVDPAGGSSWASTPLIEDLLAGFTPSLSTVVGPTQSYHFPLWLPSGCSIGARARTAHTATIAGRVTMHAYGGNKRPDTWWCGRTVESVGITAASSKGTDHTPGNSGAFSAWASLGSVLSAPAGAVQFAVQGSDAASAANQYHFEFGVGSTRIGAPIWASFGTAESRAVSQQGLIFADLASGAQLQVRGTCSGASPEAIDVAAYAVM